MEAMIRTSFIMLVIMAMLMLCLTLAQVFTTLNVINDTAEEAMLSQITATAPGDMPGFRESDAVSRYFDDDSWVYSLSDEEFKVYLTEAFNLNGAGQKWNGKQRQFTLSGIRIDSVNSNDSRITVWATIRADIPLRYMGLQLGDISKNMKVKAQYDKRY